MAFLRCENDHKRCVEEDREYFPCDPCLTLRRIQHLKDLISFFFFFPSLTIKQNPPQGMATLHRIALKLTPPQHFFLFGGFPAGVKNKKNNRERDKNDRITLLMFFPAPSSNRQQWVLSSCRNTYMFTVTLTGKGNTYNRL